MRQTKMPLVSMEMALVRMEMQTDIEIAVEESANIPRMPLLMNSASEQLPVGSTFSLANCTGDT
ncbi:hypothetical protein A9973_25535 [Achromobacter sp. UMC46]|nr:hypothetical protein [Achromobacter sp. UMC46]